MTVLGLPPLCVQTLDFDLEHNVASAESPLGNTVQRIVRSGDRWRATLNFPPSQGDDGGVLVAWLRQATRGDRWFYLSPPQNSVRGNWNPAELVSNGTFIDGVTTGWTSNNGAILSVNARRIKVLNGGAGSGIAEQTITMEAGKPHVIFADYTPGNYATGLIIVVREIDAGSEFNSDLFSTPQRRVGILAPTVASMRLRLYINGGATGDYVFYGGVSITRCLQVAGASQTGNRLNVDGGPASINAALKAGEFVCFLVGTLYQLVQLTEDFDTDSSGAGTLVFEPTLRGSPANDAAVIVRNPFARFMIPKHSAPDSVSPALFHGFSIEAVEDVTP